jgi:carbonic anhydrase
MDQKSIHPSLNHQTFLACSDVKKELHRNDETFQSELQVNPKASSEHNYPQQFPDSNPLQKLLDGNLRFQHGKAIHPNQTVERCQALTQMMIPPFAMVVSCVEARVQPEIIFDQGLGDLIVFRTPAHVADDIVQQTIDYITPVFNIPLIVILGHSKNGIIRNVIRLFDAKISENFPQALISYLSPSILKAQGSGDARLTNAIQNNIIHTVKTISDLKNVSNAINARKMNVVGCYYDVDTGAVSILKN